MVPAYATVEGQLTSLLVVHVQTDHLRSGQSLTAHTETATTAAKAHIIDVVGTSHHHQCHILLHQTVKRTGRITATRTDTHIIVGHETSVHTWLDTKVEHGLLLTIVDTADTSQVTLLVVSLDTVNDVRRQILHGSLRIARHELLTINENLLHLLTIDLDTSVIVDLSTRQALHQFLNHRSLRSTESSGIIHKGVSLQRDLGSMASDRSTLQHDGIGLQRDRAKLDILVGLHIDALSVSLEAHTCHLNDISTCFRSLYTKTTIKFCQHTCCQSTVGLQQFYRGLGDWLL